MFVVLALLDPDVGQCNKQWEDFAVGRETEVPSFVDTHFLHAVYAVPVSGVPPLPGGPRTHPIIEVFDCLHRYSQRISRKDILVWR